MSRCEQLIGVLRRCRCCDRWLSIDQFKPLGKVCQACVHAEFPTGRVALSRCTQITPKGRAYLLELHEQERQERQERQAAVA